jgi:sigma-B regulation protein RsbU (phosphoserine phosphatase)
MGIEKELKVQHVFHKLNRVIHRSRLSTGFISLFYGELESNGNLFYINAGQPPPLLFSREGFQELRIGGIPIGPLPETEFKRGFAHLDHEGVLLLYTDGLIERENQAGDHFGIQRLKKLTLRHLREDASQLLDLILDHTQKFGKGAKWKDDITVVVIKRTI